MSRIGRLCVRDVYSATLLRTFSSSEGWWKCGNEPPKRLLRTLMTINCCCTPSRSKTCSSVSVALGRIASNRNVGLLLLTLRSIRKLRRAWKFQAKQQGGTWPPAARAWDQMSSSGVNMEVRRVRVRARARARARARVFSLLFRPIHTQNLWNSG